MKEKDLVKVDAPDQEAANEVLNVSENSPRNDIEVLNVNLVSHPRPKQSRNLSINIAADETSLSSPNPSAYTDNGVTTVCSTSSETPNPHYDFDVGLVLTEFLSTL